MEDIQETPEAVEAVVDNSEEVTTPETPTPEGDAQIEETPETEGEAPEESEKVAAKKGFKQRQREARLKAENRALREQLQQRTAVEAQPEIQEPNRDDFTDYEQYLDARADYRAEQKFSTLKAEADAKQAERDRQNVEREVDARWEDSQDAAREKYDDFDAIAFGEVAITDTMGLAIKDSKQGAEIAYYLGKHPEESERIAKLPPLAQIRDIGRIEGTLNAAPARKPPPKPIPRGRTTQTTSSNTLNDDMPIEDWMKLRNKQVHG